MSNYKIYLVNKLLILMIGLIVNQLILYVCNLVLFYLVKLAIKFNKDIVIMDLVKLNGDSIYVHKLLYYYIKRETTQYNVIKNRKI
jgi:hypothetical protein